MKVGHLIPNVLSGNKLLIVLESIALILDFVLTRLFFTPVNDRMHLYKMCRNIDRIAVPNLTFQDEVFLVLLTVNFIECMCYCFCYLEVWCLLRLF